MKKVLVGWFVVCSLALGCKIEGVHKAGEEMRKIGIFSVVGKEMRVNSLMMSLSFVELYGTEWMSHPSATNVIKGLQHYAESHKLELVFE